jgi:hypothetical protein
MTTCLLRVEIGAAAQQSRAARRQQMGRAARRGNTAALGKQRGQPAGGRGVEGGPIKKRNLLYFVCGRPMGHVTTQPIAVRL